MRVCVHVCTQGVGGVESDRETKEAPVEGGRQRKYNGDEEQLGQEGIWVKNS